MMVYSIIALVVFFGSLLILRWTSYTKDATEEDKFALLLLIFFGSLAWILTVPTVIACLIVYSIVLLGMKVIS